MARLVYGSVGTYLVRGFILQVVKAIFLPFLVDERELRCSVHGNRDANTSSPYPNRGQFLFFFIYGLVGTRQCETIG